MSTSNEILEREKHDRRWAVPAAAVGGALPLISTVLQTIAQRDSPVNLPGLLLKLKAHSASLIAGSVLQALGVAGTGVALAYLFNATRARRPATPRVGMPLLVASAAVVAVSTIAGQIVLLDRSGYFASHGAQTYQEGHDILSGGAYAVANYARLLGGALFGASIVIVALNAMRSGLLTRFMGYLGIFTGALLVLALLSGGAGPLGASAGGVIQPFWLLALAYLFAGRWPNGVPPAWQSGRAEPWPSMQELREQREAAAAGGAAASAGPAPAAPVPAGPAPVRPGAARRKRKKRR
ncbi:MAG: hypothetical protein QOK31_1980 [Solirubrobacteraceae bacterium]|jgi:hypothetical protein|nr:hypothetical protein [Solirubrobacteraceae bacterium]